MFHINSSKMVGMNTIVGNVGGQPIASTRQIVTNQSFSILELLIINLFACVCMCVCVFKEL